MLIRVPRNDAYPAILLLIFTPAGQFNVKLDNTHRTYDYQLPDGVGEDQVEVYSIYLRNDQLPAPGCGPFLLKALKVPAIEAVVDALVDTVTSATANEPLPIAADVPATCPGPDAWPAPAEAEADAPSPPDTPAPADAPATAQQGPSMEPTAEESVVPAPADAAAPIDAPATAQQSPSIEPAAEEPPVPAPADAPTETA